MLTIEQTREVAEQELANAEADVMINPDFDPVVRDWCVVYAYNSRAFLETGDYLQSLAGNGPLVVDRRDGTVRYLPSYAGIEVTLPQLEEQLGVSG